MDIFKKDKAAFGPLDSRYSYGCIDARFGNPSFLHKYWELCDVHVTAKGGKKMNYLDAYGDDDLKRAILMLHIRIGNADVTERHVVLGVGASQVMSAAMYALSLDGPKIVHAESPYFSRFEHFTKFAGTGLEFWKDKPQPPHIQIITCPNNPNGMTRNIKTSDITIHDLVYNWPQYTDVVKYDEDIMVFGLAKATGHASTRVGWALVKDKEVADRMQHYIEMSTCGVGMESLNHAYRIMQIQERLRPDDTCFAEGRKILRDRWQRLKKSLGNDSNVKLINDGGMFAWGRVFKGTATDHFRSKSILVVSGEYFGRTDKYFRINMGLLDGDFSNLVHNCTIGVSSA